MVQADLVRSLGARVQIVLDQATQQLEDIAGQADAHLATSGNAGSGTTYAQDSLAPWCLDRLGLAQSGAIHMPSRVLLPWKVSEGGVQAWFQTAQAPFHCCLQASDEVSASVKVRDATLGCRPPSGQALCARLVRHLFSERSRHHQACDQALLANTALTI